MHLFWLRGCGEFIYIDSNWVLSNTESQNQAENFYCRSEEECVLPVGGF